MFTKYERTRLETNDEGFVCFSFQREADTISIRDILKSKEARFFWGNINPPSTISLLLIATGMVVAKCCSEEREEMAGAHTMPVTGETPRLLSSVAPSHVPEHSERDPQCSQHEHRATRGCVVVFNGLG